MSLLTYSVFFFAIAVFAAWLLYRAHVRGRASALVSGVLWWTKAEQPVLYAVGMVLHALFIAASLFGAVKSASRALGL